MIFVTAYSDRYAISSVFKAFVLLFSLISQLRWLDVLPVDVDDVRINERKACINCLFKAYCLMCTALASLTCIAIFILLNPMFSLIIKSSLFKMYLWLLALHQTYQFVGSPVKAAKSF